MPVFYKQRERGWDAAVRSDLRNAATAQETYLTESNPGPFATSVAELQNVGFRPVVRWQLLRGNLQHDGQCRCIDQLLPHVALRYGSLRRIEQHHGLGHQAVTDRSDDLLLTVPPSLRGPGIGVPGGQGLRRRPSSASAGGHGPSLMFISSL